MSNKLKTATGTSALAQAARANDALMSLRNVKMYFPVKQELYESLFGEKQYVRAVDDVSFDVRRGEVFGLAGESGSGKTCIGRLTVRLLEPTAGQIVFDGMDISHLKENHLRKLRRRMQPIFQDPFASMNPRMTIGTGIAHGLKIHHLTANADETRRRVMDILDRVGLTPPETFYGRYPHQVSGGQRQRVVIARALVLGPELIMADEPIAMADVSVRAVLLDLMKELQQELNLTYLFITHDLSTAKYICDRIAIMYLGQIVELGDIRDVYRSPQHPYTEALLAAVPVPDPRHRRDKPMPRARSPAQSTRRPGRFHPALPDCTGDLQGSNLIRRQGQPAHLAAYHLRTGEYQHLDPAR
jgi:peptide/nickel transport system ATP-binding protein